MRAPCERSLSKRLLFCAYLICPSISGPKALKKVFAICHIQFQWKVTEHFRNRIKKIWSDRTKISLEKNVFRNRNSHTHFYFLYAKLATVQVWEQSNKFPLTCGPLKCLLLVKMLFCENSSKNICLLHKQTPLQTQSTGFSDNRANQRLESLLPFAYWWAEIYERNLQSTQCFVLRSKRR